MITPTPCVNHTEKNSNCRFCISYSLWTDEKIQNWLRVHGKSPKTWLLRPCNKHHRIIKDCHSCNQWNIFATKVEKWYGPWKARKNIITIRNTDLKSKRIEKRRIAEEFVSNAIELHDATKTFTLRNSLPPKCGYVYLIENQSFPGWIKAGFCIDIASRLSSYQTCDPNREFILLKSNAVYDKFDTEKRLHSSLELQAKNRNNEWFEIDKNVAILIFSKIVQRVL